MDNISHTYFEFHIKNRAETNTLKFDLGKVERLLDKI